MAVEYDEKFFEEIPEEMIGEVRSLLEKRRKIRYEAQNRNLWQHVMSLFRRKGEDVSRTMLWAYANDRRFYDKIMDREVTFEEYEKHLDSRGGSVDNAFRIPPVTNAPSSDRVFCPGFYRAEDDLISELLKENGFSDSSELILSKAGRLGSLWKTFFGSQDPNGYFLDNPTITLPRAIVYGDTMKGYEMGSSSHFGIEKLMKGIGEKYDLPTFSASVPFPSFA